MRRLRHPLLPGSTTARRLGATVLLCAAGSCGVWLVGASPAAAVGVGAAATAEAASTAAADEPRAWLARTDQALATRNYRGVFVHEYAGETETLKIVHRVSGEGVSERLQSMDGSGREFIRKGNQLICYLPDRRTVLVEKSPDAGLLLGALPNIDAALAGQYEVRQLAHTRVSGRSARLIAITPMDQLRYGYQVWIDEVTAMPLKMQLRDARGKVIEQIVFTDLVLPAHITDSELAPSVDARDYRWVQQDATMADAPGLSVSWQADALPPGFRMTASARQMLPGGLAEHLVFSDGLASVSVFVEHGPGPDTQRLSDDAASMGSSSAYSVTLQGYRITAVGEVPPETVRAIAQAIRGAARAPSVAESLSGMGVPTPSRSDSGNMLFRNIGGGVGGTNSVEGLDGMEGGLRAFGRSGSPRHR